MKRIRFTIVGSTLGVLAATSLGMALLGPPTYDLTWHTIDGGGGVSMSTSLSLHGTIGQPDASQPSAGGDFTLAGGFWASGSEPTENRAELTSFIFSFGSHVSGDLADLTASDDVYLVGQSQFGFIATEPNILTLTIVATAPASATQIELTVESKLNNAGGTARIRMKNWTNGGTFEEVRTYATGLNETVETVTGLNADELIHDTDGRIELQHHQFVVATFSASGFEGSFDWIEMVTD